MSTTNAHEHAHDIPRGTIARAPLHAPLHAPLPRAFFTNVSGGSTQADVLDMTHVLRRVEVLSSLRFDQLQQVHTTARHPPHAPSTLRHAGPLHAALRRHVTPRSTSSSPRPLSCATR